MNEVKTDGPLSYWRFDKEAIRITSSHFHSEAQLIMIESGLAVINTETGHWLLPAGRCGFIPAGCVHSMRTSRKPSGLNLYLASDASQNLPPRPKVLSTTPLLREVVIRVADQSVSDGGMARLNNLLAVLCDELERSAELPLYLPLPESSELLRVTATLIETPDAQPSMLALARIAGMSERTLYRHFERETGLTIARWLQQLRILTALEALADGRSVVETALSVGYDSPSAFNRVFKETLGQTPAQYRKDKRSFNASRL